MREVLVLTLERFSDNAESSQSRCAEQIAALREYMHNLSVTTIPAKGEYRTDGGTVIRWTYTFTGPTQ